MNHRHLRLSLIAISPAVVLGLASCETERAPVAPPAGVVCELEGDLVLTNGQILTVDPEDSVASAVRIRQDRIIAVGDDVGAQGCDRVVNLGGRTVVPGIINNHMHYLRAGMRPGYDVRSIETTSSIAELQDAIAARAAELPPAAEVLDGTDFIAIIDAWNPNQFNERRGPTLAELDEAAPDHAVYMMEYPFGPGVTNSIGKRFLETAGIDIDEEGFIAGRPGPDETEAQRAYAALKENQTLEDKRRSLREFMRYSNTVGLTTVLDGGGGFPGPGEFDEYGDYDAIMSLWRDRNLTVRIRAHFQAWATAAGGMEAIQHRVDNTFMGLGNEWFQVTGFGENIVMMSTPIQPLEMFVEAFTIAAENGWLVHQHSITVEELETHTTAFEIVNVNIPIADLHWNLSHVLEIDNSILQRLKTIGAGVAVQMHYYHGSFPLGDVGPPFRTILDSGVPMSVGSDAAAITPWIWLYHMTTGKTSYGEPILTDESITRMDALRVATLGGAWDALSEDDLGSIEPGKLADVVVLSEHYLTVPEESFRDLKSVLTVMGGEIVYSDGSVVACGGARGAWFRDGPGDDCQL